jgi:hypothetical protein
MPSRHSVDDVGGSCCCCCCCPPALARSSQRPFRARRQRLRRSGSVRGAGAPRQFACTRPIVTLVTVAISMHRRARWRAAPVGNANTHSTPSQDDGVEHKWLPKRSRASSSSSSSSSSSCTREPAAHAQPGKQRRKEPHLAPRSARRSGASSAHLAPRSARGSDASNAARRSAAAAYGSLWRTRSRANIEWRKPHLAPRSARRSDACSAHLAPRSARRSDASGGRTAPRALTALVGPCVGR